MSNDIYERLLEKCGPILRNGQSDRGVPAFAVASEAAASPPNSPSVDEESNSGGSDAEQQQPVVKGILKKSPIVLKLSLGSSRRSGEGAVRSRDPEARGAAARDTDTDDSDHGEQRKKEDDVPPAVRNLLQCDLCSSSFPLLMALKQHKRQVSFFDAIHLPGDLAYFFAARIKLTYLDYAPPCHPWNFFKTIFLILNNL